MELTTPAPYLSSSSNIGPLDNRSSATQFEPLKTVVLPSVFGIVCILGLFGNALVMYIIQVKIRKMNLTDIYVINLAVADFIFLAMLPFWSTELAMNGKWIFGRALCKLTSGSTHFHMYASVFFLTAMAVDRFMAVVVYRNCAKYRTRKAAKVGSAIIWIISIFISIVPFHFRDLWHEPSGYNHCVWTFNDTRPIDRNWFIVHFMTRSVVAFTLPFLIISACYTSIVVFLKTRKTSGKLTSKRQDKATTMVLVVIAVFLLCWLPNQISNALYAAQGLQLISKPLQPSVVHYYIHMFSTCLAWTHSCVNPILYCFMREDIKLKLTEMMHWHARRFCGEQTANTFITTTEIRLASYKGEAQQREMETDFRVVEESLNQNMLITTGQRRLKDIKEEQLSACITHDEDQL